MELEITLDELIAWHQRGAQDCMEILARATYVPASDRKTILTMAAFHQAAVRLLQTYQP